MGLKDLEAVGNNPGLRDHNVGKRSARIYGNGERHGQHLSRFQGHIF